MFTLYYAPDTCALATLIAFKDAGLQAGDDYALRRVDFKRLEQRAPEYLAVNPKGRVPALVTPRGILTETPAMLAFLAQSFPRANLAPLEDPFAFADLQAFNSFLCSSLHVAHAHRMRGHRWVDENDRAAIKAMQDKVPESVSACYDLIESGMLKGPWVMGEDYTIADPYLFTIAQWLEQDGVDPARIPKVMDHRARMAARANVKAALAEENA
ncbi:MAG TPA: glutathione S-transferase [Rhodospirillaceae bacterium]|nr:glutathione S-transferase [Rhodospirillaceae bacterium]|tara:strand:+ start:110 stop:748 length:639 start_codon:yes stop_codon:yes gene_type:complete